MPKHKHMKPRQYYAKWDPDDELFRAIEGHNARDAPHRGYVYDDVFLCIMEHLDLVIDVLLTPEYQALMDDEDKRKELCREAGFRYFDEIANQLNNDTALEQP
jgi:hypothetical protein